MKMNLNQIQKLIPALDKMKFSFKSNKTYFIVPSTILPGFVPGSLYDTKK